MCGVSTGQWLLDDPVQIQAGGAAIGSETVSGVVTFFVVDINEMIIVHGRSIHQ